MVAIFPCVMWAYNNSPFESSHIFCALAPPDLQIHCPMRWTLPGSLSILLDLYRKEPCPSMAFNNLDMFMDQKRNNAQVYKKRRLLALGVS